MKTYKAGKKGFSGPIENWILKNEEEFKEVVMTIKNHPILSAISAPEIWASRKNKSFKKWAHDVFLLYCFMKWTS